MDAIVTNLSDFATIETVGDGLVVIEVFNFEFNTLRIAVVQDSHGTFTIIVKANNGDDIGYSDGVPAFDVVSHVQQWTD